MDLSSAIRERVQQYQLWHQSDYVLFAIFSTLVVSLTPIALRLAHEHGLALWSTLPSSSEEKDDQRMDATTTPGCSNSTTLYSIVMDILSHLAIDDLTLHWR